MQMTTCQARSGTIVDRSGSAGMGSGRRREPVGDAREADGAGRA